MKVRRLAFAFWLLVIEAWVFVFVRVTSGRKDHGLKISDWVKCDATCSTQSSGMLDGISLFS